PRPVDRRPIDPPPIIQLKFADEPAASSLPFYDDVAFCNPKMFMAVELLPLNRSPSGYGRSRSQVLSGSLVSSLYHLRDVDDTCGGFFVFPDLSVRVEGQFCLRFCLYEMIRYILNHDPSRQLDHVL